MWYVDGAFRLYQSIPCVCVRMESFTHSRSTFFTGKFAFFTIGPDAYLACVPSPSIPAALIPRSAAFVLADKSPAANSQVFQWGPVS